ncbi:exodeoxyribonuclease V subunit gamma [Halomonas urumqiensis]|uniref:RecBCD enzyme subunit RecC n=1 Tax=Halomonas urumqiensis TaxID=1684789 RepID=A0A2N7UMK5_9GAMM|nr:exodeoxyribonuclease V subunit gamma [Halomonas urumqiensis]PMR81664.1 exodeoxyribonuclease V subunit gamma [Halomonas urumqiensis]PTB02301.1 exodeoxyribonuclease V subunit gamma [Halomonas urumqiensis]GHE21770.1 RecBCD enzyme subunit RecC [Halomonas urumqiensis]
MPAASSPREEALAPGFMVVHGNRLEDLRGLAVAWMTRHPLSPLENETILVQSNGIGQWLKLALAEDPANGGAGIAAALDVSLPARFLWQAYRAVLNHAEGDSEAVPATSPFDKSRLVWRLLRLLPALMPSEDFAPLARFLEGDDDLRKHHQLAERLADLFDQYQVYRADWLEAWAAGEDVLITARGEAKPLDATQRWQPALWRAICDDVESTQGRAGIDASRAQVHRRFLDAAEAFTPAHRPRELPRRVLVFGISSLPQQALEALAAIARVSQVVLCVHNPCQHYWADIIEHRELLRATQRRQQRKAGMPERLDVLGSGDGEASLHLHAQPLLAAWGKQGRDYLRLLDEHDDAGAYQGLFEREALRIDLFEPCIGEDGGCLLSQLQDDIRELRPLAETRDNWPVLDPSQDDSIVFHIAHGPQREVEILHDQLLAAFSADPDLRPRDIIVMVPDIDHYAPHIQAVFGQLPPDDPRFIPYTLSDQASRHRLPLMIALEKLTRLPELRFSVSDLLDLLEVPALRARFGLAEADLPTLSRWIEGAGIRWGLDARQRGSLDLPEGLSQNTWAFGLRRLLLGYAVGSSGGAWQGIEPFDDIGGLEAGMAGPLAQLLETLETQWQRLCTPTDADGWVTRLRELLEAFFSAEESADSLMLARLEQGLQDFQESTREAGLTRELPLSVVREHWLGQIDEHSLSQRFLAGAVNFATLMPMRAIPFKRVCLLGMNDGDYPRHHPPLDFDLMNGDYRPGDRSRREDDRYLFLEALLSAREQLYISWVGRSIVDNAEKPPSVLVGQLRDHLAAGWRTTHESDLLDDLTSKHPLQPFSRRYFPDAATQAARNTSARRLVTYAHEWRDVHTETAPTQATGALGVFTQDTPLTLIQLGNFLRDPTKAFFNTRLRVYLEREDITSLDQEPFALDGLTHWQLQDTLIQAQRRAIDAGQPRLEALHATLERLEGQGVLAMGAFGERMREQLAEPMEALFEAYAEALAAWPHAVEEPEPVRLALFDRDAAEAPPLEDWLDALRLDDSGQRCRLLLSSSSLVSQGRGRGQYRWGQLVRPWVAHLAGNLERPMTTQLLSKAGNVTLPPLGDDEARHRLGELIAAWQAGMQAPLPVACDTAFVWLAKRGPNDTPGELTPDHDAWHAARKAYEGDGFTSGEVERNPYLAHRWPDFAALAGANRHRPDSFAELTERLLKPLHDAVKGGGK